MTWARQMKAVWGVSDISFSLPGAVALCGVALLAAGQAAGAGMAIGAALALLNSAALVKRVELAVESGNAAVASLSMQVGLMLTFAVIGAVTLILLIVSVPAAIAMGITFFATQSAEILFYYRGRRSRDSGMTAPAVRETAP